MAIPGILSAWGLALWLSAGPLYAAPAGAQPLTVSVTGCAGEPFAAPAFLAALQLELDLERRPLLSPSGASAAIAVRVGCDAKASIRIRLDGSDDQREVRLDDVPVAARPRVLALVVAEIVRSRGDTSPSAPDEAENQPGAAALEREPASDAASAAAAAAPAPKRPTRAQSEPATDATRSAPTAPAAISDEISSTAEPSTPRAKALKPWICVWTHLSSGAANAIYGAAAGVDWHRSRVQIETGFARAERDRGSITSGLAAARYRYSVQLAGNGKLALRAGLSAAAGVTWATGDSETPGVVVRRALLPYGDARAELGLQLWLAERFAPELALYTGGALGLVATNAGEDVLSSGGWLLGASLGSPF